VNLSENFTLAEFEKSQTAKDAGIDNTLPDNLLPNAVALCMNVLQPTRDHIGPIGVNSGYRCPELNQAVDGATASQHMRGEAADITIGSNDQNRSLFTWMRINVPHDQIILERGGKWIHVSFKEKGNRFQTRELD